MNSSVNTKIQQRRKELGFTESHIAFQIDQTISSYCDIEWYEDEIFSVTPLQSVKALCRVLVFDFFELFEIECAFCKGKEAFLEDYLLPRNQLIKKRRQSLRLSKDKLGDMVGFFEIAITNMEEDKNFLETWCLENIIELGNQLKIPLQVLIGVKCNICKR